jgi:hypothetical protein
MLGGKEGPKEEIKERGRRKDSEGGGGGERQKEEKEEGLERRRNVRKEGNLESTVAALDAVGIQSAE